MCDEKKVSPIFDFFFLLFLYYACNTINVTHAFFGDRDELFGEKYIAEFLRHYPQEQCHRIPSGHHLSEEGAREIVGWIDKNPQFINSQNHL